ncbi:hypothetical protein ACMYQ1_10270 [Shewanella oncorhynchi]|uniref:hypothetical protein n=1 Tax=Shewanella oncorhynchi TaxID=2726434 RepID=UPI0039F0963A
MFNPNVCDNCIPIGNYFLSDKGLCGVCGNVDECFDADLIRFYHSFGIRNRDLIWMNLPKLRGYAHDIHSPTHANLMSWEQIEDLIVTALKEQRPEIQFNLQK